MFNQPWTQLERKWEGTETIAAWIQAVTMTNKANLQIIKEEPPSSFNHQTISQTYRQQIKQEWWKKQINLHLYLNRKSSLHALRNIAREELMKGKATQLL